MNVKTLAFALSSTFAFGVFAADYYVGGDNASDDNDGTIDAPFATIDKAVITARTANDVIHVRPGEYETTLGVYDSDSNSKWGPNVASSVKLIGEGETRDAVVLKSHGNHRTLRMAADSWVENMTLVGEPNFKADKGGVVEMSGGTLTNCVVKDGTASGTGGAIYMTGGTVVNCVISGGTSRSHGGNIYMTGGTVQDCTILDGFIDSTNTAWDGPKGANVQLNGASAKLIRCRVSGGRAKVNEETGLLYYGRGSVAYNNASATVEDCLIASSQCGGVVMQSTGGLYNSTVVGNNGGFGVWAWNDDGKVVNCVIYGNKQENGSAREWHGNQPQGSSATFWNNAASEGVFSATTYPTVQAIDESAFVDYANGDYRPNPLGALVDNGGTDPRGTSASATDLAGNPRMSGTIDIGCYEYQKPDMTVHIESASFDQSFAPAVVTFSHAVENSISPENVVFTYTFGDGSEAATTKELTLQHAYAKPGVYTVTITAVNECEEERAEMTYEGYVRVGSSTVYVNAGNKNEAFPYDTLETGYANLKTAIGAAQEGYTLLVGEGVYGSGDQTSISKALTIKGLGKSPEAVVLRNTTETPDTYYHRTLELKNNALWVENLTIENGRVKNDNGANVRLVGGVITNCVIRGGYVLTAGENANGAGSAVELAGSGTLTHCVITNNIVDGTSSNQGLAGGAVFVTYGAKNGRVSNCLIAGNRYITSGDVPRSGTAGIRFGGGNDNTQIENNTIVANVVEGSLSEDSAGLHCTTWYGRMRNNIIAGNYETGKAKYTSVKVDKEHCTFDNNLTDDATAYTSKSFAAPLATIFKDFEKGDYTLPPTSPACNKGIKTGLALLPSVDLLGNPREFGKAIDIGCYECQRLLGLAILIK